MDDQQQHRERQWQRLHSALDCLDRADAALADAERRRQEREQRGEPVWPVDTPEVRSAHQRPRDRAPAGRNWAAEAEWVRSIIKGELDRERAIVADGLGLVVDELRREFGAEIEALRQEIAGLRTELTVGVQEDLRALVIRRFEILEAKISALGETDARLRSLSALSAVH